MATTLKIDLVVDDNGVIDTTKSSAAVWAGSAQGFAELTKIARQTLDLGVRFQQSEDAFHQAARADFDRYCQINQKLMELSNKKLDQLVNLLAKGSTASRTQQASQQQSQQKQSSASTGSTSGKGDKEEAFNLGKKTGEALEQSLEQYLMDPMEWKWETLWEKLRTVAIKQAVSLVNDIATILQGQMFPESDGKGISGLFGGIWGWIKDLFTFGGVNDMTGINLDPVSDLFTAFHSGGIVGEDGSQRILPSYMFAGAPRFHRGLAPDEVPAVLQRGEWVLPKSMTSKLRGGMGTGGAGQMQNNNYSITINAVDSKSFDDMVRRNPGSIVGVVDTNLKDNGALRQTMKRTVK